MSANHSLVLFEGDVTNSLAGIFDCFDLKMVGSQETAKGLAEIWEYTNWPRRGRPKNVVHKAVLFNGTWTAVLDREMNMILDQEKCTICAKKYNIKVFGYMIETISGTCALYYYAPEIIRGFNMQNFEVLEDFGEPLPQETGITTQDMLKDGAMRISRRLGFSDSLFAHPTSKVTIVGMEDPVRTQSAIKSGILVLPEGGEKVLGISPTVMQSGVMQSSGGRKPGEGTMTPPVSRPEKPWWKLW